MTSSGKQAAASGRDGYAERLERINCPICETEAQGICRRGVAAVAGERAVFCMSRCSQYGLLFQNPRIRPEEIGSWYATDYFGRKEDGPPADWLKQMAALRKRLYEIGEPDLNRGLLDWGCGEGPWWRHCRARD